MAIRFHIGKVVMTQGVAQLADRVNLREYLVRHSQCDWGNTDPEDKESNDDAVKHGGRILSAYPVDPKKPCKGYGETAFGSSPRQTVGSPRSCSPTSIEMEKVSLVGRHLRAFGWRQEVVWDTKLV